MTDDAARLRARLEAATGERVSAPQGIAPASRRESVGLAGKRDAAMERREGAASEGGRTGAPVERHVENEVES